MSWWSDATIATTGRPAATDGAEVAPVRRGRRWRIRELAVLVLILVSAASVRVIGHRWPERALDRPPTVMEEWLSWDEDQHLHPDGRFLSMVASSVRIPGSLEQYLDPAASPANPHNAGHDFYPYGTWPVLATRAVASAVGRADFHGLTRVGRGLSTAYDITALALLWLAARRLGGPRVAVLATVLAACSPLSIQHARFATVDAAGLMGATGAMAAAVFAAGTGRLRYWTLAGVAVGLAASARINLWSAAALVPIAALAWWRRAATGGDVPGHRRRWARAVSGCLVAAAASLVVFRLMAPYAFASGSLVGLRLNPAWLADLELVSRLITGRVDFPPLVQWTDRLPIVFPWWNLTAWGLGPVLGAAAWIGWLSCLRAVTGRRSRALGLVAALAAVLVAASLFGVLGSSRAAAGALVATGIWSLALVGVARRGALVWSVPAAWIALLLAFHATQPVGPARYLLPAVPALCLMAARWLVGMIDAAELRDPRGVGWWRRPRTMAAAAVVAVVTVGSLAWGVGFSSIYRRPHTRVEASRWIQAEVPAAVTAVVRTAEGAAVRVPVELPAAVRLEPGSGAVVGRLRVGEPVTLEGVELRLLGWGLSDVPASRVELVVHQEPSPPAVTGAVLRPLSVPAGSPGIVPMVIDGVPLAADAPAVVQLRVTDGAPLELRAAVIVVEEWDDGLPLRVDGRDAWTVYRMRALPVYGTDDAAKLQRQLEMLAEADIVVISSNRAVASVPRLARRYPVQSRLYRLLEEGRLGFEVAGIWTSWPRFGPWPLPDQEAPFAPRPEDRPRWWLPPAEESFSVYDHPRVVVLRRSAAFDVDRARELLTEGVRPARAISPISATARAWQRRLSSLPVVGEGLARWFHRRERERSEAVNG